MKIFVLVLLILSNSLFGGDLIDLNNLPTEISKKRAIFLNKKINGFKNLEKVEQLKAVNAVFNRFIVYRSDFQVYKKKHFIASIKETVLSMKGDCDDYVMAKLQALKYLGWKSKQLRLIYSMEKGSLHVKLLAKLNNKSYILDSYNKKFRTLSNKESVKKIATTGLYDNLLSYKSGKNLDYYTSLNKKINQRG